MATSTTLFPGHSLLPLFILYFGGGGGRSDGGDGLLIQDMFQAEFKTNIIRKYLNNVAAESSSHPNNAISTTFEFQLIQPYGSDPKERASNYRIMFSSYHVIARVLRKKSPAYPTTGQY